MFLGGQAGSMLPVLLLTIGLEDPVIPSALITCWKDTHNPLRITACHDTGEQQREVEGGGVPGTQARQKLRAGLTHLEPSTHAPLPEARTKTETVPTSPLHWASSS